LSLALVVIAAGVMIYYRMIAVAYMTRNGITGCVDVDESRCPIQIMLAFSDRFQGFVRIAPLVLLLLPVLLGIFTGGPLFARAFEQGTYIFSLTQSVGRIRWWATNLSVVGVPIAVGMLGLGIVASWTLGPLSFVGTGRLTTPGFETQGLTPGVYFILAFCISAIAGLFLRTTLGAMASTILLYLAFLVVIGNVARPYYLPTVEVTGRVEGSVGDGVGRVFAPLDAWIVDTTSYDEEGEQVTFQPGACEELETIEDCMTRQGIVTQTVSFHPDSQFWPMQAREATTVFSVSAGCLALGAWRVRRGTV